MDKYTKTVIGTVAAVVGGMALSSCVGAYTDANGVHFGNEFDPSFTKKQMAEGDRQCGNYRLELQKMLFQQ